jgi:hypothetical protein
MNPTISASGRAPITKQRRGKNADYQVPPEHSQVANVLEAEF